MAAHYDIAILLAPPRRPRDKKIEAAVLIIERWLLGRSAAVASRALFVVSISPSGLIGAAAVPPLRTWFSDRALS
jgi:hypothetical protein